MTVDMRDWTITPGAPGDLGFVIDSWRQSFRDAPAVRGMTPDDYFAAQEKRIYRLLERAGTKLKVARDLLDADNVIGWALLEPPVLHYVFVRIKLRRNGIARDLLAGETISQFSHRSRALCSEGSTIRVPSGWRFTPHVLET